MDDAPLISEITYEELRTGMHWGPFEESVGTATTDWLRGSMDEPIRGSLAPPALLPVLFLKALRRALQGIPPGGVLAKQEFTFIQPLFTNTVVNVTAAVADQYERRGRLHTVFEFDVRKRDGSSAARGTMVIAAPGPTQHQ